MKKFLSYLIKIIKNEKVFIIFEKVFIIFDKDYQKQELDFHLTKS